jgi:putative transposase
MNKGWKEEVELRKKEKQHFKHLPHSMLMNMLRYKAEKFGIEVIIHEESYTSKASFVDIDEMPTYKKYKLIVVVFSGKRITRGQYQTKENKILHADVNAAGNIIRKVVPDAFAKGIEGVVSRPLVFVRMIH